MYLLCVKDTPVMLQEEERTGDDKSVLSPTLPCPDDQVQQSVSGRAEEHSPRGIYAMRGFFSSIDVHARNFWSPTKAASSGIDEGSDGKSSKVNPNPAADADEKDSNEGCVTWQCVSECLDFVLFRVFTFIVSVTNVVCACVLVMNISDLIYEEELGAEAE